MAATATVLLRYFVWHYTEAPGLLLGLGRNLLWYVGHVFSVDTLARSLFAPWRRIVAERTKRWDLEDMAAAAVANFISRLIGACMRLCLIVIGRGLQLVLFVVGILIYGGWFFLPAFIASMFLYGLTLVV